MDQQLQTTTEQPTLQDLIKDASHLQSNFPLSEVATQHPTPLEWKKATDEIAFLKNQVEQYRQQLKRYTNTDRHKRYYEQNKEKVKKNAKEYLNRLKQENPEKLKQYRHNAYVKRKARNQGSM